jgi:hypothetical protein
LGFAQGQHGGLPFLASKTSCALLWGKCRINMPSNQLAIFVD